MPAVDALERKGFARRGRDPKDRRRIPLALTQRGIEFIARVSILNEEDPLVQSLNMLDEEQHHQLLGLLRQLVKNMPEGDEILEKVLSRIHLHPKRDSTLS